MRLLLVRHGQTPSNVAGLLDAAAPGPGLTELGVRQAAALPGALAGERIRALYISTLTRTRLTAEPLAAARGLEPIVLPGLAEIEAGELQGRADRDAVMEYITVVFGWSQGDLGIRMPGAESGEEFVARSDGAIARMAADAGDSPETVVAVSHAAAIRTWASLRATNIDASSDRFYEIDNTGVVVLDGSPDAGWRVLSWNGRPVGGEELADPSAADPTGEALGS